MKASQQLQTDPIDFKKIGVLIYGAIAYLVFLICFLYAIGFVGNLVVPKSIDAMPQVASGRAILVDLCLLLLFAMQHSVMARQSFKNWWTQIIPKPIERSTYVLLSSLCLIVLFWQWQPIGGVIWEVKNFTGQIIILALFALGWLLVLISTFWIDHFDLFGLRQVYLYWRDRAYSPLPFMTPGLYKYIRHPLYLGWFLAFWASPKMTVTHLVFALVTTAYILVAIQFEERDLLEAYGKVYADYRQRVPMFIPFLANKQRKQEIE